METLLIEEKSTMSRVQRKKFDDGLQVSTVFYEFPLNYLLLNYAWSKDSPFLRKETIGTTVSTLRQETKTKTEEEDYEIGYYNDDYDIVAKAPIKQSFKVKVKIKSITKLQPKAFIDFD